MRLKDDGSLDLDWQEQPAVKTWQHMTVKEREAELMAEILEAHPGFTREEAQELLDSFFYAIRETTDALEAGRQPGS
jgi:hypothetical protein